MPEAFAARGRLHDGQMGAWSFKRRLLWSAMMVALAGAGGYIGCVGAFSSAVEQILYTDKVGGSIPSSPTIFKM